MPRLNQRTLYVANGISKILISEVEGFVREMRILTRLPAPDSRRRKTSRNLPAGRPSGTG